MKLKQILVEMNLYNPPSQTIKIDHSEWTTSWKYTTDSSSIKNGVPSYGFFRIEGVKTDPKDTYPSILNRITRNHLNAFKVELNKFLNFKGIVYTGIAGSDYSISVTYISTEDCTKENIDKIIKAFKKTKSR